MNRISLSARPVVRCLLAASLLLALVAGLVPGPAASAQTPRGIASGRVIVVVEPGIDPATVANRTIRQGNGQVGRVFRTSVRGFSATLTPAQAAALARDPAIRSITPDYPVTFAAQTLPTGVNRIDADKSTTAAIDGIDTAMDIDIAIIDSGISAHPDLNVVGGVDCTGRTTPSYADDNGHGTHVAGTAAARDNGFGVVGVAPGARLWAVKALDANGSGSFSTLICAADWVTQNAGVIDVVNMSISTASNAAATTCASEPFHGSICASVAAGVTYVVAAGNASVDAGARAPAMFSEVITVSALDDRDGTPANDTFASFSNWGAVIDIAAPGVQILSTTRDGAYGGKSGTSMASPHVAGAVGLLIAERGRIGPSAVQSAIIAGRENVTMSGDPDGIAEGILRVGGSVSSATPTATATMTPTATATLNGTLSPPPSGTKLPIVRSFQSSGSTTASVTYDLKTTTAWYTTLTSPPSSAWFTLDTGASRVVTGIRWQFSTTGAADQFSIQTSTNNLSWTTVATGSNAPVGVWQSVPTTASARYVRFLFANPNRDARLGHVSEVEIYPPAGTTSVQVAATGHPTSFSTPTTVPTRAATSTAAPEIAVATTGDALIVANTGGTGANCRVAPGVDAAVIAILADGTFLETTGDPVGEWQPVSCAGQRGFVNVRFLTSVQALPAAPPTDDTVPLTEAMLAPTETVTMIEPPAIAPTAAATATPTGPTPFPILGLGWSTNSNPGDAALDGNPETVWRVETGQVETAADLIVDLGSVQPIGVVRWVTPLTGPTGALTLQVSEDGERWMTVGQPEWWDVDSGWRVWEIDVAARFVRFTFTNRDERLTLGGLAEVEVYAATGPLRTLAIDTPTPVPALPMVERVPAETVPGGAAPIPTAPPETPVSDEPPIPSDPPATNAPEPALDGRR